MEPDEVTEPEVCWYFYDKERTAVHVDLVAIPIGDRGKGIGTRFYKEFEEGIPETVEVMTLIAVRDLGTGDTVPFWKKFGYEPAHTYTPEEAADEHVPRYMHKGLNGHPTPAPRAWTPEDEGCYCPDIILRKIKSAPRP